MSVTTAMRTIYPHSSVTENDTTYFLTRLHDTGERRLAVSGDTNGFVDFQRLDDRSVLCTLTPANAVQLRARLPWLNPVPLGLQTSFGFGDRLGVATAGHIDALSSTDTEGEIAPIFAQQSVRENSRIGRTPQQVMDDAMWGVFQEGWHAFWGADADHVKSIEDLAAFVEAGYPFYTIDPSDYVEGAASAEPLEVLRTTAVSLAWDRLDSSYEDMVSRYCTRPIKLDGLILMFDELTLARALAKYGHALVYTLTIADALTGLMNGRPFDLEMSIDETDTPTSVHEHYFIANELHRCGVPVVSLAPRFVGKFQKGVDYIGDPVEFEREFKQHAIIMRHFGTYKISIHTGSDKFSIYPIIARHAQGRVHVKTAGTSYLEALRVMANTDPDLFRKVLDLAHQRFEKDRKTYFLDCQPDKVPSSDQLDDGELPALLEDFHARQLLHVTFGSALDAFGDELRTLLDTHEAAYQSALRDHFKRHINPFM